MCLGLTTKYRQFKVVTALRTLLVKLNKNSNEVTSDDVAS